MTKLDICLLLAKFQNRNSLGTCFTYKQNVQFCKQNMVISLIFGLLKVHSSTNKYFYEKRILYMKSAHSNYGKKSFFKKIWKVGQIHMEVRYRSFYLNQLRRLYIYLLLCNTCNLWLKASFVFCLTRRLIANIMRARSNV